MAAAVLEAKSWEATMPDTSRTEFDPVSLEIFWSRLISIADESAAALLRTSFSTIVRESNDFATALMDANGDSCPRTRPASRPSSASCRGR